jgi:hypothetical protein
MRQITCLLVMALFAAVTGCRDKKAAEQKTTVATMASNPKELALAHLQQLENLLLPQDIPLQYFTAAAGQTATFVGKKGLKVTVNPGHLCFADGSPVTGEVRLLLKEATTAFDMMLANAPTVSNGRLLESGGSYYIGLTSNGTELRLKEGKALQIEVPRITKKGMQLFYGQKDEAGFINWTPAPGDASFAVQRVNKADGRLSFNQYDYTQQVITGHEVITRPATLAECMKIYGDSVWCSRHEQLQAMGHKLTRRQEIDLLYAKVEFPYKRFNNARRWDSSYSFEGQKFKTRYASYMYLVPDTIPIYKEVKPAKERQQQLDKARQLDYYEPEGIGQLGWINVDRFYNNPDFAKEARLQFGDTAAVTACKVYTRFVNINSLMGETILPGAPAAFVNLSSRLPVGEAVEFIVMAMQNGQPVTGRKKMVLGKMNQVNIDLVPVNTEDLKSLKRS